MTGTMPGARNMKRNKIALGNSSLDELHKAYVIEHRASLHKHCKAQSRCSIDIESQLLLHCTVHKNTFMNIILFETTDTISLTRITQGLRHSAEEGMICWDE